MGVFHHLAGLVTLGSREGGHSSEKETKEDLSDLNLLLRQLKLLNASRVLFKLLRIDSATNSTADPSPITVLPLA